MEPTPVHDKRWFYDGWNDLKQRRTNRREILHDYFMTKKESLGLDKVESCISIGSGDSELDCLLLRDVMPGCKTYYGVEPEAAYVEAAETNLQNQCPSVKFQLFQTIAEEWPGPSDPVDVVLMMHSLYYIKPDFLARCLAWVRPGGLLITALMDKQWPGFAVADRYGKPKMLYTQEDVTARLPSLDLHLISVDIIEEMVDMSHKTKAMADIILEEISDGSQVSRIFEIMDELEPSQMWRYKVHMTVLKPL